MAAFDAIAFIDLIILILSNDSGALSAVRWLLVCFVIALTMKPLFEFDGLKPVDEGFSISFGLGLAASFTLTYFLCTLTGCPFNSITCIGCLVFIASAIFFVKRKAGYCSRQKTRESNIIIRKKRERFLIGFAVFSLLFLIAFWVKGFKPLLDHQTEQFMDYGFMTAMYRQQKIPFEDMWFLGQSINYYYLGQAVAVFICRLGFVTPEYGYNFMLCTVFAALLMTVFTVVEGFLRKIREMNGVCAVIGGAAASLMCTCGGNGHWLKYGLFGPLINRIMGTAAGAAYYFADPTMYIGSEYGVIDKGKHEFPAYTMVLGDLHAHVCNMLFTIPLLAVLFDYALDERVNAYRDKDEEKASPEKTGFDISSYLRKAVNRHTIAIGILLGLFQGVNYWDFPMYYVIAGAIILFCDIRRYGFKVSTITNVLLKGAVILLIGAVTIFPFNLTFNKPVSGIHLTDRHSPPDRYFLVWSVHIIIPVSLLIYVIAGRIMRNRKTASSAVKRFNIHELVMIAVTLCGLGLLALPEFIYVKDIYGDNFQRYNTMFKLTFQGFILLSVISGICIGVFLNKGLEKKRSAGKTALATVGMLYLIVALLLSAYIGSAVKMWFGNIFEKQNRWDISCVKFISWDPQYDNVREVIALLNEDHSRSLHLMEEAGSSYSPENRVSVFTGASIPAGWYVHEWLWHNDSEVVHKRHDEVRDFYSLGDEEYCREIVGKYKIDYIYVGPKTLEKYAVNYDGFSNLGDHIWESIDGSCMLIRVNR